MVDSELLRRLLEATTEALSRQLEEIDNATQEIADAAVDEEDTADKSITISRVRIFLCKRPHPIRIDRIPWYTSGFQ